MKYLFSNILFAFLLFQFIPSLTFAQQIIGLSNPSFEDEPRKGSGYTNIKNAKRNNIIGWYDCGIINFPNETAPDIHGERSEYWNIQIIPNDGSSFLGLVVRDNDTWESVSQELRVYLNSGNCYHFTIDLSMSNSYMSGSRLNNDNVPNYSYNTPSVISIWGGDTYCEKKELLYESLPIDHQDWRTYEIIFEPITSMKHFTIEAYYKNEDNSYNGNILIDNISEINRVKCDE